VAFCEAHDANLLSELDVPNRNILRNYNTLKSESDPAMPCLQQEQVVECPCWTADELLEVFPPKSNIDANLPHACRNNPTSVALENLENFDDIIDISVPPLIQLSVSNVPWESNCVVVNMDYAGGPPNSDIHFDVSEEEFRTQSCKDLLAARANAAMMMGVVWDCFVE